MLAMEQAVQGDQLVEERAVACFRRRIGAQGRGARGREGRGDVLTSSSAEAAPAAKVPAAHSTAEVSIARSADLVDADFDFEGEGT